MNPATARAAQNVRRGSATPPAAAVSVIVLVTNETSRLRRCVDSIAAHRPGAPVSELIVVANGTPRAGLTWLAARDDVVLLHSPVNLGFGGGCHRGVEAARGQALLFMNDDAVATAGWMDELQRALDDDERIGVAGSRVLLGSGLLQEAGGVVWRDGTTSGVGRGMRPERPEYNVRRDVDYVSFCSVMVRRQAWDAVGGFDDRYFPAYYEDTDFCLTARSLGWRVVCEPRSVVVHGEGGSTSPRFKQFLTHRNRALFVAKWQSSLDEYQPPPSLTAGQRAVVRALDRSARAAQAVAAAFPGSRPTAPAPAGTDTGADETDALQRLASIRGEYVDALTAELAVTGPAAVARSAYAGVRARAGRLLSRHQRLSDRVRSVIVSVGNRE